MTPEMAVDAVMKYWEKRDAQEKNGHGRRSGSPRDDGSACAPIEQVHDLVEQYPEGKLKHFPVQGPVQPAEDKAYPQAAEGVIKPPQHGPYPGGYAEYGQGDGLESPAEQENCQPRIQQGNGQFHNARRDEFHVGACDAGHRPQGKGQNEIAQGEQIQYFQRFVLFPVRLGKKSPR